MAAFPSYLAAVAFQKASRRFPESVAMPKSRKRKTMRLCFSHGCTHTLIRSLNPSHKLLLPFFSIKIIILWHSFLLLIAAYSLLSLLYLHTFGWRTWRNYPLCTPVSDEECGSSDSLLPSPTTRQISLPPSKQSQNLRIGLIISCVLNFVLLVFSALSSAIIFPKLQALQLKDHFYSAHFLFLFSKRHSPLLTSTQHQSNTS